MFTPILCYNYKLCTCSPRFLSDHDFSATCCIQSFLSIFITHNVRICMLCTWFPCDLVPNTSSKRQILLFHRKPHDICNIVCMFDFSALLSGRRLHIDSQTVHFRCFAGNICQNGHIYFESTAFQVDSNRQLPLALGTDCSLQRSG